MKNFKRLIFLSVFVLCLTSCKKAPEQVLDNKKNYNSNKQVSDFKIKYCTLNELKKTDISKIKYKNLDLPKEVYLDDIKGIYLFDGRVPKDYLKRKNQILSEFGLNKSVPLKKDIMRAEKALVYDSESYLCFLESGEMSYLRDGNKELPSFDESNSDYYYLYNKKTRKDKKIIEILKQVEKDDKKGLRDSKLDYIPKYIALEKNGDSVYVHGTFGYKGIGLLDSYTEKIIKKRISPAKYEYINHIYEKKDSFTLNHYYQTPGCEVLKTKKVNRIVSLESAVHIVSNKLSGFHKVGIMEIVPVYMCLKEDKDDEYEYVY